MKTKVTKQMTIGTEKIPDVLGAYLYRNARIWGDKVAMRQKQYGIWREYTWKEVYEKAKQFGCGVMSIGIERGNKACILGDNEAEAYFAAYGLWSIGVAVVGMWTDVLPDEAVYFINDSESRVVVVRDQEQVDKMLRIKDKIPTVEKVIWWEPKGLTVPPYSDNPWLMGFFEVLELGRQYEQEHPGAFEKTIESVEPQDVAAMYYTSGTTGLPKGVVRSHTSQISQRRIMDIYYPLKETDNLHAILPFASIGEPIMGSVVNLVNGTVLNFPETPDTTEIDMREVAPSFQALTPRFYEEIASKMRVRIEDGGPVKRALFNMFLPVGYKVDGYQIKGKKPPLFWRFLRWLGWHLVFRPNLDKAGLLKMQQICNSGFVLGLHTFRFFRAIGLPMREFYASTEVPIIATHWPNDIIKLGSLGRVAYQVEVRLSDDNEIYIRGPHRFTEYYRKPDKTRSAIDAHGWYHSGDAGTIDDEGYIFYWDRVSELASLADGTKYSPQGVEAQVRFGAYIKDCWILGEDKDYLAAIITIDLDSVSKWAERNHVPFTTMIDLSQKDEVAQLVLKDIVRVNSTLQPKLKIKKYAVLHKEFNPDEAELTRTRKLRREFMWRKYGELAEAIYQDKEVVPLAAEFVYADGTKDVVRADVKIRNVPGI